MAGLHGWVIDTKNTQVLLSIIAFFSKSKSPESPTCDGFYQYIPATRVMLKWTQHQGEWEREQLGIVIWVDESTYRIDKQR